MQALYIVKAGFGSLDLTTLNISVQSGSKELAETKMVLAVETKFEGAPMESELPIGDFLEAADLAEGQRVVRHKYTRSEGNEGWAHHTEIGTLGRIAIVDNEITSLHFYPDDDPRVPVMVVPGEHAHRAYEKKSSGHALFAEKPLKFTFNGFRRLLE